VSDQARLRALRQHAVFFLTKPVPIMTLVALVDSTLKKSAQRAASRETPIPPPRTSPAHGTPIPPPRPTHGTPIPPPRGSSPLTKKT
jgi:hypothetical protein